ncbi:hypothetical protein [Streptomyces sp. NPDC088915]|uniref:hypothetical protein n=1 Tax=Streptomyces sp. NPDC088915 TaxID=3365912 RepID=UPI00382285ED
MITVTLHFPHADFEGVELPALPAQGDNLFWHEEDTEGPSEWKVTSIDWFASRYGAGPGTVAVVLEPANMAAHQVSERHKAEGIAEARALDVGKAPEPRPARGPMTEEKAAALIKEEPELALLGTAWVKNLSKFGLRPFQMLNLVRHVRSRSASEDECTCVTNCAEDPKTACALSGRRHVHPAIPGRPGVYGPCPEHPDAPGDH